jgi:histidine triad (HIT) family protein
MIMTDSYSHAPLDYVCPFCLLLKRAVRSITLPSDTDIIVQTELVTAIIGTRQWPKNAGNTIILPNQHYENIFDLPASLAAPIQEMARAVALAMKDVYRCSGISLRQHNEPAGNQEIWHYHMHVTPRYLGDEFYAKYSISGEIMPPDERAEHASVLRRQVEIYLHPDEAK